MKTITEIGRDECFGCELCANVCSKNAIAFRLDSYFYYPYIDDSKCIRCGRCFVTCPVIAVKRTKAIDKAYLAVSKDKEIYDNATSGGVFGTAVSHFIKDRKGYACGACADERGNVAHKCINDSSEIEKLQGSKYVQSRMADVYADVDAQLKRGKQVIFCGTPCQVAAMRQRFSNNHNLYLIDLVCHGVSSPQLLIEDIARIFPANEKIEKLQFRKKTTVEDEIYNLKIVGTEHELSLPYEDDAYYKLFIEDRSLRLSCYSCPFSDSDRIGDITIGDCCDVENYPDFHADKTVSTIYIVTDKGRELWDKIKDRFYYREVDAAAEMKTNEALNHPAVKPDDRDTIFSAHKVDLDAVVKVKTDALIPRQNVRTYQHSAERKRFSIKNIIKR